MTLGVPATSAAGVALEADPRRHPFQISRHELALSCVLVRSGQEPVVVNLEIPAVEPNPEQVHWVDNIHPAPKG